MKTKILLAAVAGALVLPAPMASQADVMSGMDFKISGRVSAGILRVDSDKPGEDATVGLGSTIENDDRTDSRITLSADRDTDFGTAGFKLERDWQMSGLTDNRHQYVYLGGEWGTFYMGNHGTPVGMGNGYDQSNFFGGGGRINDGDRRDGIGYTYSNGAFSLGVTLHGQRDDYVDVPTRTNFDRIAVTQETEAEFLARVRAAVGRVPTVMNTGNTGIDEDDRDRVAAERYAATDTAAQRMAKDLLYANRLRGLVNAVTTPDVTEVADRRAAAAMESELQRLQRLAGVAGRNPYPRSQAPGETVQESVYNYLDERALEGETRLVTAMRLINAVEDPAVEAAQAANKKAEETVDTAIVGASYDFGTVKVGLGYWKDNTETGHDSTSVMVSGAFNQFSYWAMFETASDATPNGNDDVDGLGVHLQYALTESDNVYLQYGSKDYDLDSSDDTSNTVLGYSHSFGGGVTGIIEYYSNSVDGTDANGVENPDPSGMFISARVFF